jgi:WD40 repeat protein
VLVLFAPADEAFVRGFLLPALGPSAHGEAVVDARDLAATEIAALDDALLASEVAIAVLTPAFLTNPWSRQSELIATGAALDSRLEFVPLWLEDCTLPPHLRYRVLLDFRDRAGWDREIGRLRVHLSRPVPVEQPVPCPYPGMRPFQAADAKFFYGRDTEIDAVLGLVAAGEREIYVIGPSGSGKSSLLGAGVLPRLAKADGGSELVVRTMRPGDAPLARLAECLKLAPDAKPDAKIDAKIDAAAVTAWAARHGGARLVVVVDQLEELFTQAAPAAQSAFATALAALRAEPRLVVLLALRADFYAELLQSELWLDGHRRHVDLPPLRGAALRAAIERPARALEVYFAPGLVDRLLADAAGEPGALPLLQETLVALWGRRTRRLLTLAAYEALGEGGRSGLAVAISSRADRLVRALAPAEVAIARRTLLRLVSFGEGRPNTRRRQARAQLAAGEAPAAFAGVLQQLAAARLVTLDGDAGTADAQVDLCHEVLITAWPWFAAWVDARRADELRRREIQASAEQWLARGRGDSGLLDAGELSAAVAWRRTDAAAELGESSEVTALIDASTAALGRSRRRRRQLVAGVVGGLAVFAGVTTVLALAERHQARVAEDRRRATVRMLGEQYLETARQAMIAGHDQRAVPFLVAARDQGIDAPSQRSLFHRATMSHVVLVLRHDGPVVAVGFSDAATRVVTASRKTVQVWDAATGQPIGPPMVHDQMVDEAKLSGDGSRVLAITKDNTAWIWQVTAKPPPPIALHHAAAVGMAAFSSDGSAVLTASGNIARLWSTATGQPLSPPMAHGGPVRDAVMSRDGTRVATALWEGTGSGIWNAKTGARIAEFETDPMAADDWSFDHLHLSLVGHVALSADGRRAATAGSDQRAVVWDTATGKPVAPPLKHDASVGGIALSPDGTQVATADDTGHLRVWDVGRGEPLWPMQDARIDRLAYSDDGARLVAVCFDKMVRIWDTASGRRIAEFELASRVLDFSISRDAARVATADFDGAARIWSVRPASRVVDPAHHAYDAAYSPDGRRIVTTDTEGGVRLWAATGALLSPSQYPGAGAATVVFDHTGARFALLSLIGNVRIGDSATGEIRSFRRFQGKDQTGDWDMPGKVFGHQPPRGAFSPDGARFATIAHIPGAQIWDLASGEATSPLLSHGGTVLMVRWSPDGRHVVTAGGDATARIWDAASGAPIGKPLRHPDDTMVTAALYSADGAHIITLCNDHVVRVWNPAGGDPVQLTGHTAWVIGAAVSPDGTRLLTHSDDGTARIWDLATGRLALPPLAHVDQVGSAAFSPDGERVVTTSDELAQLWDARTGLPLGAPFADSRLMHNAAFSADGASLVTAGDNEVVAWDVALDASSLDDWHRIARDSPFPLVGSAPGDSTR